MSGIIPISRFRKRKEDTMKVLAAMSGPDISAIADTPFGRQIINDEKKRDDDFKKRYRETFDSAPDMPVARIKYFCRVLLKLWPDAMQENDWKARSLAFDDVFNIYMQGVDKAYSDWCRRDQKTEEMAEKVESEYPFPQLLKITKENMGLLLPETLEKLLSICSEEGYDAKKEFLWELVRLFEICRGILYVFSDEVDGRDS